VLQIEWVQPPVNSKRTGIGRTVHGVMDHLQAESGIQMREVTQMRLPLANRFMPLRQLPLGIHDHRPGSIVHFMQIVGCAQMVWRPVHPAAVTVHDLGVLICAEDAVMFNRLERRLLDLQYAGLPKTDALIAVSGFTANSLQTALGIPPELIHVVYNGVDHLHFRPYAGARLLLANRYGLPFDKGVVTLLYVGSELPRKNFTTILEALAILRQRGAKVRLIKVGGAGGERWHDRSLSAMHRLGLGSGTDVIFFESVPDDDLPLFYNAADLFVTASLLEGFGLPVLEALACGTPVIAASAGALPEIATDAALYFDPHDVEGLVEHISEAAGNFELRDRLRRRGLDRAQCFSWEQSAQQLLTVYRSLASAV
jgi:glycosyltransferase involved in cell wall biosynthesis